ncbi:uncharacterized protein [Drosophila takahashii]|uniref:uncharacterized protein n=1 Tax=Drosophila takahashii TaxID=29030 RepID=UPI001CF92BDA|nr:uncharacterized protein LOC108064422 [Drosophila takahashii]
MCRRAVREWLVLLTMEKYIERFLERGYDSIASCKLIVGSDLVMLGVDDATHRKLLLDGVQFLNNAPERFTCKEPCELHHHLDSYVDAGLKFDASKCWESLNFPKSPDREEVDPLSERLISPKTAKRALNQEFDELNVEEVSQFPSDVANMKLRLNNPLQIEK